MDFSLCLPIDKFLELVLEPALVASVALVVAEMELELEPTAPPEIELSFA